MKNLTCTFAFVSALVLSAAPATAATKVFLLGGQSNMAGLGGDDYPLPAPYNSPQTGVKFWNYGPEPQPDPRWNINYPGVGTGWVDLQNGFGHTPENFGPEVTFGYTLSRMFPGDEIYLIKEGITSQDLAVHWNPDGSGDIYNIFKSRVDAAMQNLTVAGKSPQIAGMIWMQGESDAMNHSSATAYAANLENFIDTVRSDFNTPNMPFVAGRITTYEAWGTPGDIALVRNAQMTVPAQMGNGAWINTDDLQWAYGGHYGTQGQIDLGIRFANALAQISKPSVIQTNETVQSETFAYSMPANNLIRSGSATLGSQYNFTPDAGIPIAQPTFAGLAKLNDGVIAKGKPTNNNQIVLLDGADGAANPICYQVFELNLAGAPLGYDLTAVSVFASWISGGGATIETSNSRLWQNWQIGYNLVGETYSGSGELNHFLDPITPYQFAQPAGYGTSKVSLTGSDGILVSGVSALEIRWLANGQSGGGLGVGNLTSYSEVAMCGVVSTTGPIPDMPGDANRNGVVDENDAAILAAYWQTASGATWGMGDFNNDGAVNDIDAALMAANWQSGVNGSVPEPSALASLLGLCLAVLFSSIWRKQ